MIVHQKPYLHASKLIPLGMARGLMFEEFHAKNMNWDFMQNGPIMNSTNVR
jgi:hypothetical protein